MGVFGKDEDTHFEIRDKELRRCTWYGQSEDREYESEKEQLYVYQ